MTPASSGRVPAVIARTEFRRSLRVAAGNRTKALLLLAISLFALGPITVIGTFALRMGGERIADGTVVVFETITVTDIVTGTSAIAWLFVTVLATIRTITVVANLDQPACLLVSTRLRNVVIGLIGAEILRAGIWVLVPTLILSSAFALGAGTPLPVLFAIVLVAMILVTAFPVGFIVGVVIRHLITSYEPIARYRTPLVVLLAVAYFGAIAMDWVGPITHTLFDVLGTSPLGWPGHILLLGIPNVGPSIGPLIGSLVGSIVLIGVGIYAGTIVAGIHWYAEPAQNDNEAVEESTSSRLDGLLGRGFDRPVRTVAVTAIRRTRRAPVRLLYVVYPLLGAIFFIGDVVEAGTLPSFVAVLLCLYVVWGSGALFTLNVLGELGQVLPTVLTSTVSGRAAVGGLVVAGALVSLPVAILVSLVVGAVSPLSITDAGLLGVGTVIGAAVGPALATGIGALFPRFGSVKVTNNREAVMPSKTAFLVYSLAIALPVAAATVLWIDGALSVIASIGSALLSLLPGLSISLPDSAVTGIAWVVLPAGLLAPYLSYRYAIYRFEGYTLN